MFLAGELWRVPVYVEDVAARNVGGADVSLVASIIGVIAFGASAIGLWRRQRWAPIGTLLVLGFTGSLIVVNVDSVAHPAVAIFGAVVAFTGVAGALPLLRRPVVQPATE
jgi:hypothetical protein